MTNEQRRQLDRNKRVADDIAGKPVNCFHGHRVGQVVATAATKDGIAFTVQTTSGQRIDFIPERS